MVDDPSRVAQRPNRPAPTSRAGVYAALLRNRGFRNLAVSTLISTLGDWIGFLAIIALTTDILGPTRAAAFAVSGVMAARVLPSLLLGPIAGVFVDRWHRKRVMLVCHLGRGIVMALIPFTNEILALLLATLTIEVMSSMYAPAKDSLLPSLVSRDELVIANQLNLVTTYGTLPLGGAMFAVLVSYAGAIAPTGTFLGDRPVALAIWFNAVSFFVAAPLVARIPFQSRRRRSDVSATASSVAAHPSVSPADAERVANAIDPSVTPGAWEQLKEGFRFIGGQPVIRSLILGVMVAFAAAGVVITAGEFFVALLNSGKSGYGVLVAVVGTGLLIGLVIAAPLIDKVAPERLFSPGIGLAGLALMATAVMPTLFTASIPGLVMGIGAGVSFIVGYTVLQHRADDRIRGRTFGAFNSGVRAAIFGSTILVPTMIGLLGRERRVLTTLADGTQSLLYPYTFGGVRITLLFAGFLALLGAIATGWTLHRALVAETAPGDQLKIPDGSFEGRTAQPHGVFIAFEGGDGAGKSTQIRLLRNVIERSGHDVMVTREPGGTAIGEAIRAVLLSPNSSDMSAHTEALLYAAARAQHVGQVIRPALQRGTVVLCDRFVDSSIVYQGVARELGDQQVAEVNRWATAGLQPDLTVLLDIEPGEGLRRATRDRDPDRMESAGDEFHRQVRDGFIQRADAAPERYLVVDSSAPVEAVHQRIRSAVVELLEATNDSTVTDGDDRMPDRASDASTGQLGQSR